MTTTVFDLIHAEQKVAFRSLTNDHTALIRAARETDGTPVGRVLRRVLEWRQDTRRSVWLHAMLVHVVGYSPTTFMRGFVTFMQTPAKGSRLPPFAIDWVGPTGEPLSKDNPYARPEVRAGSRGLDVERAQALLNAMDVYEARQTHQDARNAYLEGSMVDDG